LPVSRRINVVLPEATVRAIDRIARSGQRSRFIDEAVKHYVVTRSVAALRSRLELAAVRDRDLDREVASDWLAVDRQEWQKIDEPKKKLVSRGGGKSTSRRSIQR